VEKYRSSLGCDPRVVLVPGFGIYYAAPDLKQLRIVAEVYRGALAAILRSSRAGGPRLLTRSQAAFIENWEVEAFRARLASGGVPRLSGRIGVIVGAGARGARVARELCRSGATVFLLDRDLEKISRLTSRIGESCVPLRCDPGKPSSLNSAFTRVEESVGGIDFLVDEEARDTGQ
jgi:hypothetical protein